MEKNVQNGYLNPYLYSDLYHRQKIQFLIKFICYNMIFMVLFFFEGIKIKILATKIYAQIKKNILTIKIKI